MNATTTPTEQALRDAFAEGLADGGFKGSPLRAAPPQAEPPTDCREDLAMMIRMLVSALRKARPCAPQDLDYRAINLLRKHDLLGSPLRETDPAAQAEPPKPAVQRAALRLCLEHFERELADDPALIESDFAEAYRATVAALA